MATTPALTPEIGSTFLTDIGVQLNSYAHDWIGNAWLDHGIQFMG
jgi:hypothetical protein